MSRASVLFAIQFWGANSWVARPDAPPGTVAADEQSSILQAIGNLYDHSPTARGYLETLAAQGPIRIGFGTPQFATPVPDGSGGQTDPYLLLDPAGDIIGITSFGTLFHMKPETIIGHEISHWVMHTSDPVNNNITMNTGNFDFVGDTVRNEWTIALEMGFSDFRADYFASFGANVGLASHFDIVADYNGSTYSNIVRLGDNEAGSGGGAIGNDLIDYSQRTDGSSTLTFALSGNDTVIGGDNVDWIYGGIGNDTLKGGNGDDHLFGGGDDDTLVGGNGADDIWGGDPGDNATTLNEHDKVDYTNEASKITIKFNGDELGSNITVTDGSGDLDDLHSIEEVIATQYRDVIKISGHVPEHTYFKIDAGGGQFPHPFDSINLKNSASGIRIIIGANTDAGVILDRHTGGQIDMAGFHTGIVGSDFDDDFEDKSTGHKFIHAGDGNDTIQVGDDGSIVYGGSGDDTITGGDGSDLLSGDDGINILDGEAGSDLLISKGGDPTAQAGDTMNGGDGADKLVAMGWGAHLDGGAGNDVIDVSKGTSSTIVFQAGSGHDFVLPTLGASYSVDMSAVASTDVTYIWSDDAALGQPSLPIGNPIDIPGSVPIRGALTIVINSTGDTLTFADASGSANYLGFEYHDRSQLYYYGYGIPITFSDGGSYNQGSFQSLTAYTTAPQDYEAGAQAGNFSQAGGSAGLGNDTLTGGSGDDSFVSSGGSDTINGGDGQDEFVVLGSSDRFALTSGSDGTITLTDRNGVEGKVTLTSIESVAFLGDDTTKAVVNGTSADDVLNAGVADVATGGAGNDIISAGDHGATLYGGSGNDQIFGGAGDDILSGDTGADQLAGGAGSDIYQWAPGDGSDTIIDASDDVSANELDISGVNPFAVDFTQDGDDLLIGSGSDQVRIVGQLAASGLGGTEYLSFENGPFWTRQDILDHAAMAVIAGTSSNDQLTGAAAPERFDGGAGDDIIQYSGGDDRYVWNVGDGNDQITGASVWSNGSDTVMFGPSVSPGDVTVRYTGAPGGYWQPSTLLLTVAGGGGRSSWTASARRKRIRSTSGSRTGPPGTRQHWPSVRMLYRL